MIYKTFSAKETIALGEKIGGLLVRGDIIAYNGGLGVGKTTFTRGIVKALKLGDCAISPTFTLVNEYHGEIPVYHFDMYRISSDEDIEATGFFDYPLAESIFIIEWAENIPETLSRESSVITINIRSTGDESREIEIRGDDRFDNIGD